MIKYEHDSSIDDAEVFMNPSWSNLPVRRSCDSLLSDRHDASGLKQVPESRAMNTPAWPLQTQGFKEREARDRSS